MSSVFSIAVSGLNNAVARIAQSTSNIVNASSTAALPKNSSDAYTGFTPQDTVSIANANGGVSASYVARNPAYVTGYDPSSADANAQGLIAQPNVDLTSEIVSSKADQVTYGANAAVIKISEKMQKALLDALH